MGLSAEILAVGPFSEDIVDALEHAPHRYEGTSDGTLVLTQVIGTQGSQTGHKLAKACGVDAWDFTQHRLEPANVDVDELDRLSEVEERQNAGKAFAKLAKAGFTFFYLPNGQ